MNSNENEYLTRKEAAELLRCSTRTLQIKTDKGLLPSTRLQGFKKHLYKKEDLLKMLGQKPEEE